MHIPNYKPQNQNIFVKSGKVAYIIQIQGLRLGKICVQLFKKQGSSTKNSF